MTTDNTEASLSIGESRPVMTGTSQNTYGNNSQYSYRDIGIQLTVTPHINPNRFVVMEVSQQADEIGGSTTIDGNDVPIITQRSFDASVAVPDRGTVALGGLIRTKTTDNVSKIPVLGDIPLLGRLLFSRVSQSEEQTELVVLMTPYVMTNNDELLGETQRIYNNTSIKPEDWNGSDSALQYQN
jgi:general secretion pathway protein D